MLAKSFDQEKHNPKGWLMSEKLDGVRCFWNGTTMFSRNGNKFYLPQWFKDQLPKDIALDGELWTKRDDFQRAVSIVKRQDENDDWKEITYMVYDAPCLKVNFAERLKVIEDSLSKLNSKHCVFHKQVVCKSQEHLDEEMEKVLDVAGEGMMIKDPKSKYEGTRSDKLLKVKKFEDAEATVYGFEKGKGRLSHLTGALMVVNDKGIKFKVGSGLSDRERRKPPKKGSRITYKF